MRAWPRRPWTSPAVGEGGRRDADVTRGHSPPVPRAWHRPHCSQPTQIQTCRCLRPARTCSMCARPESTLGPRAWRPLGQAPVVSASSAEAPPDCQGVQPRPLPTACQRLDRRVRRTRAGNVTMHTPSFSAKVARTSSGTLRGWSDSTGGGVAEDPQAAAVTRSACRMTWQTVREIDKQSEPVISRTTSSPNSDNQCRQGRGSPVGPMARLVWVKVGAHTNAGIMGAGPPAIRAMQWLPSMPNSDADAVARHPKPRPQSSPASACRGVSEPRGRSTKSDLLQRGGHCRGDRRKAPGTRNRPVTTAQ